MSSALDNQVGGEHYKSLAIQPVQFSMANGWDACLHSALKYVVRHSSKNGREDLAKAAHFVRLRAETMETLPHRAVPTISIGSFIEANGITDEQTDEVLHMLQFLALVPSTRNDHIALANTIEIWAEKLYP